MRRQSNSTRSERGQVVVIVAMGMVVMIAMVGLVIDGGFAWGQLRKTQNGADAVAEAGATVIAQSLKGVAASDGDVGCALEETAAANGVVNPTGTYTDWRGDFLTPSVDVGACGSGGTIPPGAQGVKARGERQFDTFLARVIGFNQFTATADATAVAGVPTEVCAASEGCPVLPVTFPLTAVTCDGQNRQLQIPNTDWPLVQVTDPTGALGPYASTANEAIVPLCSVGPGAVGWLDFECGNLDNTITEPCNASFPIPTWVHTQPGNTNSLDDVLNDYAGPVVGVPDDTIVLIPINDNTCMDDPGLDANGAVIFDCPGGNGSGNGNNFYYHVPKFTRFMVDQVYTSGSNPAECAAWPGSPPSGGNGATGCFKGWFVSYVGGPGPVGGGATGPEDPGEVVIQLIR